MAEQQFQCVARDKGGDEWLVQCTGTPSECRTVMVRQAGMHASALSDGVVKGINRNSITVQTRYGTTEFRIRKVKDDAYCLCKPGASSHVDCPVHNPWISEG